MYAVVSEDRKWHPTWLLVVWHLYKSQHWGDLSAVPLLNTQVGKNTQEVHDLGGNGLLEKSLVVTFWHRVHLLANEEGK